MIQLFREIPSDAISHVKVTEPSCRLGFFALYSKRAIQNAYFCNATRHELKVQPNRYGNKGENHRKRGSVKF